LLGAIFLSYQVRIAYNAVHIWSEKLRVRAIEFLPYAWLVGWEWVRRTARGGSGPGAG
jgi:hypothetical protein